MEAGGLKMKQSERIPDWALSAIHLYNRCLLTNEMKLPSIGGVEDQSERIMQMFEIISDERHQFMQQQQSKIDQESKRKVQRKPFYRRLLHR